MFFQSHCNSDWDCRRFRRYPSARSGGKPASVKQHTLFLGKGCILSDGLDLPQEPFSEGWTEATETTTSELDARIRSAGWHFVWIEDSHSSRGLGRTPETAIHRGLVRALKEVKGRFNAAEVGPLHIARYPGFRMASVTLHTRQIQMQTSLDRADRMDIQKAW